MYTWVGEGQKQTTNNMSWRSNIFIQMKEKANNLEFYTHGL